MCGSLRFSHHEPTILKRFCETTHSFPLIFKSTQMVFIGLSGWTIYMLIQINRHFCKRHIQRKREIDDCMKIQWTGSKLFLLNVWAGNMCYTFQLSFVFEVEDHSRIYAINTNLVDFFADINFSISLKNSKAKVSSDTMNRFDCLFWYIIACWRRQQCLLMLQSACSFHSTLLANLHLIEMYRIRPRLVIVHQTLNRLQCVAHFKSCIHVVWAFLHRLEMNVMSH